MPFGTKNNIGEIIVLGKDFDTLQACIDAALTRVQWYEVGKALSAAKTVTKTAGSTAFVASAGVFSLSDDMRNWFVSADAAGTSLNNRKWYPIDYLDGTSTIFSSVAAQESLVGAELKFARPNVTTILLANRSIKDIITIHAKSACLKFQDGSLEGTGGQVSEWVDSGYLEWNNVKLQSTSGVLFSDANTPYANPIPTKRWVNVYAKNSGGLDGNFLKSGDHEIFGGLYEGINHIWTGLNNAKGRLTLRNVSGRSTSVILGAQPTTYLTKPAPYSRIFNSNMEAYCAADAGVAFQFIESDGTVLNGAIYEKVIFRVSRMGAGNNTIKLIQASGTIGTVIKFKDCHWVIDDDVGITTVNRFYLILANTNITLEDCTFPRNVAWTDVIVGGAVTITHVNNFIPQTIVYAAAITPNPHFGDQMTITLTGALTINAPSNPIVGQRINFFMVQGGAGSFVTTWDAVFRKQADGAGLAGTKGSIAFQYDGAVWLQVGSALAYF